MNFHNPIDMENTASGAVRNAAYVASNIQQSIMMLITIKYCNLHIRFCHAVKVRHYILLSDNPPFVMLAMDGTIPTCQIRIYKSVLSPSAKIKSRYYVQCYVHLSDNPV